MRVLMVVLLGGVLALQACSADREPPSEFLEHPGSDDGGSDNALLEGSLSFTDGCVTVTSELGPTTALGFEEGTATWDEDKGTLTVGGHTFGLGDHVSGTGGVAEHLESPTCRGLTVFSLSPDGLVPAEPSP